MTSPQMAAQRLDIHVYDNDTTGIFITLRSGVARSVREVTAMPSFDLAGWGALLQVRRSASDEKLLAELSTPSLAGHSGMGVEIVDPMEGTLSVTFSPLVITKDLLAIGKAEYDLLLIHPEGMPYRVMFGALIAKRGVSRISEELRQRVEISLSA